MKTLIGPFTQILPLSDLPLKGPIADHTLEIIQNGGLLVENGTILEIGSFKDLHLRYPKIHLEEIIIPSVLLPGFVDCHTHICYSGNRAEEYALRNLGFTYLDVYESGGGIWSTVLKTRASTEEDLLKSLLERIHRHQKEGVTTIEIKSGYGLNVETELKQLRTIREASALIPAKLIPTCLAAHVRPKGFDGTHKDYLNFIQKELLPVIKEENLSKRVDIFIEKTAFSREEALPYLTAANFKGFDITIHADQFSPGGSGLAFALESVSVDHLEVISDRNIMFLSRSSTVGVVLPGSSIGLGNPFAPARKILNQGASLAIASDWNPGSGPMGDLLMVSAVLGAYEKLSSAEVFAGITFRAAAALNLFDRGILASNKVADFQAFPISDYREILYNQGKLKPYQVWIKGLGIL